MVMCEGWQDIVSGCESIKAIFKGGSVSVEDSILSCVSYDACTGFIYLDVDVVSYPIDPPRKWSLNKFNTVQLRFRFSDVKKYFVCGVTNDSVSACFDREDGLITFKASNEMFNLLIEAGLVQLSKVSAYKK